MRADVENIVSSAASAGISGTSTGQLASEATSQQLAYALELGQDQGRYLARLGRAPADDGEPSPQASTESVAAAAAEVQAEDADSDEDTGHAEEVGSAAAEAFGSLLSFPSGNAAIQILQEYVSGVLEDGPAADALADFAGRVGGDDTADPAPSRRSTLTKRGRDLFGRQRITDFRRRRLKYRGGRRLGTGGGDDGGGVGASGGGD
jgi:hypothetical protein